jgi:hypothetical protein
MFWRCGRRLRQLRLPPDMAAFKAGIDHNGDRLEPQGNAFSVFA